jgi:hypothetical protein
MLWLVLKKRGFIQKNHKREGNMGKKILFLMILTVLICALAGVTQAGQGRMGGMGDPYGLVKDDSEFNIHPAKLAGGEGIRFYGYYRFTYTGVADWDFDRDYFNPAGVLTGWRTYDIAGDVYGHDALVGAAFPLGPGRMGLFFEYAGMRGNYDGDYFISPATYQTDEIASALDDFALRILYGIPVGGFNLGGEVQFSYQGEENENFVYRNDLTTGRLNEPGFPFCFFPYDSSYWEALLKGSLEGMVGPLDLEFTLRGGFIFAGDNTWEYEMQTPVGTPLFGYDLDGGVDGWRIGGDLWVRYPVDSVTLPFLVRVDYQEKNRDGDGVGTGTWAGNPVDYEHSMQGLDIEVGGGVEKELNAGTMIAGGIYYHYLQHKEDLSYYHSYIIPGVGPGWENQSHTCPDCIEHLGIVRLAGEHEVSPSVALRAGLGFFCGWMRRDSRWSLLDFVPTTQEIRYPRDGLHWGIEASLGGTVQFNGFAIEPFISGGWQQYDLSGDGDRVINGVLLDNIAIDESRGDWYIRGGCAFLFDLP